MQAGVGSIEKRQSLEIASKEIAQKKVDWSSQMRSLWAVDVISDGMEETPDMSKLWRKVKKLCEAMITLLNIEN